MIQSGSTVRIHYTLTVDGKVVDSSSGGEPLSYVQGRGQIIPGLEEQVSEMKAGDKRTLSIAPEKAYGRVDPKAFATIPKEAFESVQGLEVGMVVRGRRGEVEFQAVVSNIGEKEITLDLNHPLAGKTLAFDVELVDVKPPLA